MLKYSSKRSSFKSRRHPQAQLWIGILLLACTASPPAQTPYSTDTALPTRYAAVHGRAALLGGNASAGLEGWAYPLQIFRGLKPFFLTAGASSAIPSIPLLRRIEYTTTSVERTYVGPNFTVHEKLFIPLDLPAAILTYTVDSPRPLQIEIRFTPVLDLMWPIATGGQEIHWLPDTNAYLLSEPTQRFHALFGSPDAILHDDLVNTNTPLSTDHTLRMTLRAAKTVHVFMAADTHGADATRSLYNKLFSSSAELETAANNYALERARTSMQIDTPDAEVNQALAWSQVALDQAWVCNPTLGCGLVAGYGPSRGLARRPQYAWFFAGDALTTMHTLLLTGEFNRTKQALLFLMRYQDRNSGMMWHEMSQSASYVNWAKDYPYMFPHVDITFQFLSTLGDYANATADTQFLREHWSNIEAAYRYCSSLIDASDGLPKVPAGKEGGDEQAHPREELNLAVAWAQASQAFAQLAELTGHSQLAEQAHAASLRASKAIPSHFWNAQQNFWNSGITESGKPEQAMHLPPLASLPLLNSAQQNEVLDRIAGPEFQTAWGTRGVGSASPNFDPSSYATGSVWATSTATAALELWRGGRPEAAWKVWHTLLPWLKLDAMGHMHETLSGTSFHPQIESVPEQTWSSATFVSSFLQGVLGLQLNAEQHRITLAPNLPAEWDHLSLQKLRVGNSLLDITLHRSANRIDLQVRDAGAPIDLNLLQKLPSGSNFSSAQMDGRRISTDALSKGQEVSVNAHIQPDGATHIISIAYRGTP